MKNRQLNCKNKGLILTVLLFVAFLNTGWCGNIIYPWNATTAIVKTGDSFEIWYDADENENIQSLTLIGPYNTVPISSFTIEKGFWVYDDMSGNTYNQKISADVPEGTPEDKYDIKLLSSSGTFSSIGAVKVIRTFKKDYSVFHISDTHLCNQSVREPGAAPDKLQHLSALVDIANIIGPDIVFLTGDNVNSKSYSDRNNDFLQFWPSTKERVDYFYSGSPKDGLKGVHDFFGATFSVNGNHDQYERQPDGKETQNRFEFWNRYHGIRTHHFTYGNTRFMALSNAFGEDLNVQSARHGDWLEEAGSGNLRVVYQHIYNQVPQEWFNEDSINLGLCGHNHHIGPGSPYPQGNTEMYIVNFTEYLTFNMYFINENGEYEVINNATAFENPKDDPKDWIPKLTLSFEKGNDGTSKVNTATLINNLDFAIPGAHIRFIMEKGSHYTVSKGSIDQAFDGDSVHIVDVSVPLGAGSSETVKIIQAKKIKN